MKADKSSFWKAPRRIAPKSESPRESIIAARKGLATSARGKSEECVPHTTITFGASLAFLRDETQLGKLRQLGMSSGEEAKLLAMRDYIAKLADAISR
jgi:phosphoinositide-3-kinase, regulatory subunit 4